MLIKITKNAQDNKFTYQLNKFKKVIFPEVKMGNISIYDLLLRKNEVELICFISTLRNKYKNIYDLGANVGIHSAFYAQFFKEVYAYEPYNYHLKKLRQLKKINKLKNLKIIGKAVAEISGIKIFYIMLRNTTANNLSDAKRTRYGKIIKTKVMCESINKINKKADLIKIDVEGYEGKLISAVNFLKDPKKNADFIIEVHNKYNSKKIYNKFLKNNFYEIFLINNKKLKKINSFSQFPKKSSGGHLFFKKKI
jgi:FkbM family methyltransferase